MLDIKTREVFGEGAFGKVVEATDSEDKTRL